MRAINRVVRDLLKLSAANPTLPIVAMVRSEVVDGEDYGCWAGMVVGAEIEELWTCWEYDGRTWTREEDEDDLADFMESIGQTEEVEKIQSLPDGPLFERAAMKFIAGLPWEKAIVLFVDTLES